MTQDENAPLTDDDFVVNADIESNLSEANHVLQSLMSSSSRPHSPSHSLDSASVPRDTSMGRSKRPTKRLRPEFECIAKKE